MEFNLSNDKITVGFSTLGGEIRSIKNNKTGNEYLWQGNPEYWAGRSPNLFPIVGRVKEGKYTHAGKEYSIKSPHGFVRISDLTIAEKTDSFVKFTISSSEETKKVYPFDFDYSVSYTLDGAMITVRYDVYNKTDGKMFFSLGAHPGFNVPINKGEKFEDYSLNFEDDCFPNEVICDNCFVTGDKRPFLLENNRQIKLRHNLFDNDAIIITDMDSRKVKLSSVASDSSVTVDFKDFAYLGFWHKPLSDAPYICIEPWNGLPSLCKGNDELSEKPAMMNLEKGEKYSASYSIKIA